MNIRHYNKSNNKKKWSKEKCEDYKNSPVFDCIDTDGPSSSGTSLADRFLPTEIPLPRLAWEGASSYTLNVGKEVCPKAAFLLPYMDMQPDKDTMSCRGYFSHCQTAVEKGLFMLVGWLYHQDAGQTSETAVFTTIDMHLRSLGNIFKLPKPRPHPKPIKSGSLASDSNINRF